MDPRSYDLLEQEQNSLRGGKHRLLVHMKRAEGTADGPAAAAGVAVPLDDLKAAVGAIERVQNTIETVLYIETSTGRS